MRVLRFTGKGRNVRRLRTLLGLSRLQLAGLTGFSYEHIKSVENNRRPLTFDFASTLSDATGVAMDSLLDTPSRNPLQDRFGSAFTKERFRHYGRGMTRTEKDLMARIKLDLSKLSKMAREQGSLVGFLHRLDRFIEEFARRLGLREEDCFVASKALSLGKGGRLTHLKRQRGHKFGGWRKEWEREIPPALDDLEDDE